MKTSEKTDKLFPALFKAKQEFTSVSKSADNPFFKSKYASLNEHLEVVDPVLYKNGLMLLQPATGSSVESIIVHSESGQWVSSEMNLVLAKNSMQDAGSAVTYARRYTLGALLSLRSEDDDGETAVGRGKSFGTSALAAPTKSVAEAAVAAAVQEREVKKSTFRKPSTPAPASSGGNGWDN
jgi:hypothetical protein